MQPANTQVYNYYAHWLVPYRELLLLRRIRFHWKMVDSVRVRSCFSVKVRATAGLGSLIDRGRAELRLELGSP